MPTKPPKHKALPRITPRHQVETVERWGAGRGGRPWRRLRLRILERDSYTCAICGKVSVNDMQVDHVVPLSRGGTDAESNLRATCASCHATKTARESRGR